MLNLSQEQRDRLLQVMATLLKDKVSLEQALREEKRRAQAQNEELFLELLEVVDTMQSLLDYMAENPELNPGFIKRLPKSLAAVQKKFFGVLEKRQVQSLEASEGTQPDFSICRVVDCEVRNDLKNQTITKVVRRGFRVGDKILRPIEVITSKTEDPPQPPSEIPPPPPLRRGEPAEKS